MTETNLTKEYKDHLITLDPVTWRFTVTGPEFEKDDYGNKFDSFGEARNEITKRIETGNAIRTRNLVMKLRVLTEEGNPFVIERINRVSGTIQGVAGSHVYPNLPWLRELLLEYNVHNMEMRRIHGMIRQFQIAVKRAYGRVETDQYVKLVKELEAEHKRLFEIASAKKN